MLLVTGRSHRDNDVTRVCRLVPRLPLPEGLNPAAALLSRLLCNTTHSERSGQADTLVAERQQSPAASGDGGRLGEEASFGRRESVVSVG